MRRGASRIGRGELMLLAGSLLVTYFLIECGYFVATGYQLDPGNTNGTYVNGDVAAFDLQHLYLWKAPHGRMTRFFQGDVVFDQVFSVNNRGFISSHDYPHERPENTKRIVVFGDSFTAGEFLAVPWPDRVQELLQKDGLSPRIEVDSFGVDGGGLPNWHRIFFEDIVPNYQIDGIVIASFDDDLERTYTIYDMDAQYLRYGRFDAPPASRESYEKDFRAQLNPIAWKVSDAEIDRKVVEQKKVQWTRPPLKFYGAIDLKRRLRALRRGTDLRFDIPETERLQEPKPFLTREELEKRFPRFIDKLFEIQEYARSHEIPVLLATIPSRPGAMAWSRDRGRGQNSRQREIASIAALYGHQYFDGFQVFAGASPDAILNELWLQGDGHWNQKGSDLFAEHMSKFIRAAWLAR